MQIFVCNVGSPVYGVDRKSWNITSASQRLQTDPISVFSPKWPYERWQHHSCEWTKGLFLTSTESSLTYTYNALTYVIEQESRDIKMATVINNFTIW